MVFLGCSHRRGRVFESPRAHHIFNGLAKSYAEAVGSIEPNTSSKDPNPAPAYHDKKSARSASLRLTRPARRRPAANTQRGNSSAAPSKSPRKTFLRSVLTLRLPVLNEKETNASYWPCVSATGHRRCTPRSNRLRSFDKRASPSSIVIDGLSSVTPKVEPNPMVATFALQR